MADVTTNVARLLTMIVDAVVKLWTAVTSLRSDHDAMRSEVEDIQAKVSAQADQNQRFTDAIAALQGHVEPIAGETGLATQLGDLAVVPALQDQLTAAVPPTA